MAVTYRKSVAVRSNPGGVFAYLADAQRWPEWAFGIIECLPEPPGQMRNGTRLVQKARPFGRTTQRSAEVVSVSPDSRLVFASRMGPSPIRFGYDIEPMAQGSRLTGWVEVEPRALMLLIAPLLRFVLLRPVIDSELKKIKHAVEAANVGDA